MPTATWLESGDDFMTHCYPFSGPRKTNVTCGEFLFRETDSKKRWHDNYGLMNDFFRLLPEFGTKLPVELLGENGHT